MKNITPERVIVLALLLMMFFYLLKTTNIESRDETIKQNEIKLDSLRSVIVQLEKNQIKYDSTISNLNDSLLVLNDKITVNENKIKDLRKKYNDKIKTISSFSSAELEEFLTNRYK